MSERLNLSVDDGVSDLLSQLAGGERKRGEFLSKLLRGMAQHRGPEVTDTAMLGLSMRALYGQVQSIDGRLAVVEAREAARD